MKPNIGDYLKSEREKQHLTLEDIANKTLVRKYYLEQIENNKFERYDGFVNAYIRKYAEALGLDPEPLVLQYKALFEKKEDAHQPNKSKNNITAFVVIGAVIIAIVLGIFVKYSLSNRPKNNSGTQITTSSESENSSKNENKTPSSGQQKPANEQNPPSSENKPNPPKKAYSGVDVVVSADKLCWVGVTIDGKYTQLFIHPGEKKEFKGKNYVKILFGNATHAFVTLNGKKLGVVSKNKKVVEVVYKKP